MFEENTYIILGITGVGKSTLIKVLSDDKSIQIGETYKSCTKECKSYNFDYNNIKYCFIDTPGFVDTEGDSKDKINYEFIKQILTDKKYKIKGIIIIFNFQENKFLTYHEKSLKKIIDLVPLNNFWSYITIVFSHTYGNGFGNLEEKKKEKLKNIKQCLKTIMDDYYYKKGIEIINLDNLNCHFINIMYGEVKKEEKALSDLIKSLEKF